MELKLRLVADGEASDVLVEAAGETTVGELAIALFPDAVPVGAAAADLGLAVGVDTQRRPAIDPSTPVDRSGLCSGDAVGPTTARPVAPASVEVATLTVLEGPDAPATFELPTGRTSIGRGCDRDIRLTDPLVSKRHAELVIDDGVEVFDDASANGLLMSGRFMTRAVLQSGDRVVLGATTLSVALHRQRPGRRESGTNNVSFNRSPRLDPQYEGVRFMAPEPPRPPAPQRFPVAMALAPIALAVVLYMFTQNLMSILFFALSPVLIVGSWFETRSANKRQIETETARFRSSLADLAVQLDYASSLERCGRRHEHPGVVELIEAVEQRGPLIWTRRPDHRAFGQVRLGLGAQPSRNTVEMPSSNATFPGLWRELTETVEQFAQVTGVPVVGDLRKCGNVGVAGTAVSAEPLMRGILAQLVALHSPAELNVAALASGETWDWLKWLPHANSQDLAGNAAEAALVTARLESILDDRIAARASPDDLPPLPLVVVFIHDDSPIDRSRLVQIAERGPDVAIHVAWVATSVERLPAACRTFLAVDANTGRGRAGFAKDGSNVADLATEPIGAAAATHLARRLSPMVDSGAPVDTSSQLPSSVALVDLLGHELAVEPEAVADRWRENESVVGAPGLRLDRGHGLRAVVGRTVDGPMHLDLRTHGPHALVGGTTGSGKSEFLQSWILGMAAHNSPSRVTFLLVDYKGGAAFAECVELPHCVGLVTDLSPHLVRRALASLDAELLHRERLLHAKRAKDLLQLEQRNDPECPPSLVVVVDEFAALVADVPEFVDGVLNIAQRGRSLGLHLVLATQRPAGVIGDNLRANTNLRIALRMADEDDSNDVIGATTAATFDAATPGRAIVKAGPGRVDTFQAAYAGGHRTGQISRPPIEVRSLRLGVGELVNPAVRFQAPTRTDVGPTDIERMVRTIGKASSQIGVTAPRRPWLPELATTYRLEALPTARTDERIVFGVADQPGEQRQPPLAFHPDIDGNLAVFGTGGTGKSGALRALAIAAGFGSVRGGPTWVYGIDFGSRGLQPLTPLPHVGSIIPGDDVERVRRLLRRLDTMIETRAARYAAASAATVVEYRQQTGDHDEPRVILVVDGVGPFRAEFDGGVLNDSWDNFLRIAANGRALGIHVVMSADRPASVPSNLAASVQRRLVLRLATDIDLAMSGVPAGALHIGASVGRGYIDDEEVQVAVVGGSSDLVAQRAAIERCATVMVRSEMVCAPPVASMPSRVSLSDLPASGERPTIGLGDDTLAAVEFEPSGSFLVAGPPRSGTSTTVATMLQSLERSRPENEFVLFGAHCSPLASVVSWAAAAEGPAEIERLAIKLTERLVDAADRSIVVVVEGIGRLSNTEADSALQDLLRTCRDHGVFVIAEGETSNLTGSWPLLQTVKAGRSGIVLQPDQIDGEVLMNTPFPRTTRPEFPVGRGLMVQGGHVTKVQVALPE